MKSIPVFLAGAAVLLSGSISTSAFAEDYSVDPNHSSVSFSIRHMVSRVAGNFRSFDGKFSYDEKKPEASSVTFNIKAASIDTNNAKRDQHLQSADFFDVAKCPDISFKSTKVDKDGDKKLKVTGDLTMHCMTKPATFDVEYMGQQKDPMGAMKLGYSATTKLDRKNWGINWNKALDSGGVILGDEVEVRMDIEAGKSAAASSASAKAEAKATKTKKK